MNENINLIKNGARFLSEGYFLKALESYQKALETTAEDENHDILEKLGTINKKLGRFQDSLNYFQRCLEKEHENVGKLKLLNNVCEVQAKRARYNEANTALEDCIKLRDLIQSENIVVFESIKIQRNRALLLGEKGRYVESLLILDDLINMMRQEDDDIFQREYAKILLSRSQIYMKFSRLDESREDVEKCLNIVQNRLESYSLLIVGALHTLAILDRLVGKEREAEDELQRAIEIGKVYLGEDHIEIARLYKHLGIIYLDKRELNKSEKMIERSYQIYLSKLGEEHPLTISTYNNLGEFYAEKAEFLKAEEMMKRALELRKKVFGEDHPDVAESHFKLGELYSNEAKYKISLHHLLDAKRIYEKVYRDVDQLFTAGVYNQLGIVYLRLKQLRKAQKNLKESLRIKIKLLGKNKPEIAISYSNLGLFEGESGNIDGQIKYYQKALKIQKTIFGEDANELVITYHNLGVAYDELNDLKKALIHYQKALDIEHRIYGESHPLISTSYLSIGNIYQKQSKNYDAGRCFYKGLRMALKFFDQTNVNTTESLITMAELYKDLKNFKGAQNFLQKSYLILKNTPSENIDPDILQYTKNTLDEIDKKTLSL